MVDHGLQRKRKATVIAVALRKPEILVFDAHHAERWRVFKEDFSIYIDAAYVAEQTLVPHDFPPNEVQARLQQKRDVQKKWFNKTSRPLPPLTKGQVVRLQTDKGHDRIGVVSGPTLEQRSYIVRADGGTYRRNRQHLLPVNEPILPANYPDHTSSFQSASSDSRMLLPTQQSMPATVPLSVPSSPALQSPASTPEAWVHCPTAVKSPALCTEKKNGDGLYRTPAGHVCRPVVKYPDYV